MNSDGIDSSQVLEATGRDAGTPVRACSKNSHQFQSGLKRSVNPSRFQCCQRTVIAALSTVKPKNWTSSGQWPLQNSARNQ
jgi:hypothetical protein